MNLKDIQDYEALLGISQAIASIQDRKQLLKTIYQRIKPVFPYDSYGLFVLTEDGQYHHELIDAAITDKESTQVAVERQFGAYYHYLHSGSNVETFMQQGPGLFLLKDYMNHLQAPYMYEAGIRQLIAGPLTYAGEAIGMLCFNSNEEDFYTEQHLPLFQAISEQISVAVANVLANEQLREEKKKTEDLLKVTETIANINSAPELIHAIFNKLQQVFPFDETGLFHLDLTNQRERDLIVDYGYDTSVVSDELKQQGLSGWLPLHKLTLYLANNGPVVIDTEELYQNFDHPHFLHIKHIGFQQIIAGPLKKGKETIGLLYFWSKTSHAFDHRLPLFKSITDQLSVALNNVLANEQLQEEKQFKETLLSISEAVARIQDRKELFKVIFERIQPLVKFDDFGLFHLDESGQYHRDLAVADALGGSHNFQANDAGLGDFLPHHNSVAIFIKEGPLVISLKELMKRFPGHAFYPFMEEANLKQIFGGPLIYQGKKIGMLAFNNKQENFYSKQDFPLFQAIADQLAVAIANVLANESLLDKQREKSEQLALNQSLIKIKDFDALLRQICQTIHERVDFDAFSLWIYDEQAVTHHFLLTCAPDGSFQDTTHNLRQRYPDTQESAFSELQQTSLTPRILTGKVFEKVLKTSAINQQRYQFADARSVMEYPIEIHAGCKIRIALSSTRQDAYRLSDLKTFEHYLPPIALAIQNQIAFQKIKELKDKVEQEKESLEEEIQLSYNFEEIIGQSEAVKNILYQVGEVARTDSTVLITGETGTGKELIARAIHGISDRKHNTLIKLNCAALPTQLLESELFGHEKGAFTGAIAKRVGKFEIAHQSTIFLDEIGELPLELQAKLLRVIQEKEFERIGSNRVISVDTRIIAATNRHLPEEISQGRFRSDLYYRLNVYPIPMPALRERREDIPLLIRHFLKLKNKKFGKKIKNVATSTLAQMMTYDWPGNIRELEHVLERAMISSKQNTLYISLPKNEVAFSDDHNHFFKLQSYEDAERELIFNTLKYCNGRISGQGGAAEVLELPPSTLESKMRRLGIKRKHVLGALD